VVLTELQPRHKKRLFTVAVAHRLQAVPVLRQAAQVHLHHHPVARHQAPVAHLVVDSVLNVTGTEAPIRYVTIRAAVGAGKISKAVSV